MTKFVINKTKDSASKTGWKILQDRKNELQDPNKVLQDKGEPFPRQKASAKRQAGKTSKTGLTLSKTEDEILLLSFSSYFVSWRHKKEGIY